MDWFMFQIIGVKQSDGSYQYTSNFTETQSGYLQSRAFNDEHEMRTLMASIFAAQRDPDRQIDTVLSEIQSGGYMWFKRADNLGRYRDIDLTEDQAESLGWIRHKQQ